MSDDNKTIDNGASQVIRKSIIVQPVDMGTSVDERVYSVNDLPELVSMGETDKVLEILKSQRTAIVMHPTKSRAAKRRELKDLQDLGWSAYREFGREISKQEWKAELRLMYLGNN